MTNTIKELLNWAKTQLSMVNTADLDAEILLAHILQINRAQLYSRTEQVISLALKNTFEQMIARRLQGVPVAYITGYREFWSLPFLVTPDTLIPRPETECLVEAVLAKLPSAQNCKIADLGTGSGAIALAIASERPHWSIVATDKMVAALAVAQRNAENLRIRNVHFRQGHWCEPLLDERFDAIVSNPPYINKGDQYWREQINLFEPTTAFIAAEAGLADLHTIIKQAPSYLKSGGWLLLEHGYDQVAAVKHMLEQIDYKNIESRRDLANIERVVIAQFL